MPKGQKIIHFRYGLTRLGFEPSAEEIMTSGETQPNDVDAAAEADKPDFAFASLADVDELMFG